MSDAIDNAIDEIDFAALGGKDVYFDPKFLKGVVDENYIVSALRQRLLASGCVLRERREDATYVVEVRAGAVGTDRQELVFGLPAVNVPNFVPGMPATVPSSLPELPLAKKTNQKAVAKISVYAYNRETGLAVWQSGVEPSTSMARDTWVLGAGPFRRGQIHAQGGFAKTALGLEIAKPESEPEDTANRVALDEEALFEPEIPETASMVGADLAEVHPTPVSPTKREHGDEEVGGVRRLLNRFRFASSTSKRGSEGGADE